MSFYSVNIYVREIGLKRMSPVQSDPYGCMVGEGDCEEDSDCQGNQLPLLTLSAQLDNHGHWELDEVKAGSTPL